MQTKTQILRNVIQNPETVVVPGAYNALTARLIEEAGFPVGYITGAGVSNSMLGLADIGLLSFKEIVDQIGYIADNTQIPFIADGDTGFGNTLNVFRTVRLFEKAGAAGIQLEDQVFPKRCGHFTGKSVISKDEMVAKIKAAVDARQDDNFVVVARTDARAVYGLKEAMDRSIAYYEAGADVIFVEAPTSLEEVETVAQSLKGYPLLLNMVEGGFTPQISRAQAEQLGFKFVLYANAGLRASVFALQKVYKHIKDFGSTANSIDQLITMDERNRLTRLSELRTMEVKFSE